MNHASANSAARIWHSDDLLVRIANGDDAGTGESSAHGPSTREAAEAVSFGKSTLSLVADDPRRFEQFSLLRSVDFTDEDLTAFGARARATWALDALVGRKTRNAHDWSTFRAEVAGLSETAATSLLDNVSLDDLWTICEVLHERNLDPMVEHRVLQFIASRVIQGASVRKQNLPRLVERLLQAGLGEEARALLPRLPEDDWLRHAFTVELHHPRFGGSFDAMLRTFNEVYRRLAIEQVGLVAHGGASSFDDLHAAPLSRTTHGPLVSVIMTCWNPGPEIFTAVRSIVAQTYQNWELIITDDASSTDASPVLERVAALDARIRIIRNDVNAGTYVRRNEAIQAARGDLVTMQDSDDWAHPRRLEVQASDLGRNPLRLANVVHAARLTADLSFVSRRGAKLFLAEPSLMFRREAVVSAIGYYDSIRKSADTEFRKRLEAVTKRPIPVLLPGAPLQLMLADEGSLSGADFGTNIWNHPDRLTYWSATRRYLQRIEAGFQDPYLPFPLQARVFHAPRSWLDVPAEPLRFDLVLVLDGREATQLADFHRTVVEEIKTAAEAGLRLGIIQSDSLTGPRGMAFFPAELQALVDNGVIERIGTHDVAETAVAVIRHAGAAQGHLAQKWALTAARVVVIEDPAARDVRAVTIAESDVVATVAAWFDTAPEWRLAPPTLPVPTLESVAIADGSISLSINTELPRIVGEVRLTNGSTVLRLTPTVAGPLTLTCSASFDSTLTGDWTVSVAYHADGERLAERVCAPTPRTIHWNRSTNISLQTDDGSIRVLPPAPHEGLPGGDAFAKSYAVATIAQVSVIGDLLEVAVTEEGLTSLAALYALREVDKGVVRRRDFAPAISADGSRTWRRPLAKFADSRWQLFGSFRTPVGLIEYPVAFADDAELRGSGDWQPQMLTGGRLLVALPQPSIARRAARRLAREVSTRMDGLPIRRSTEGQRPRAKERDRVHFDARYGEPRVQKAPTVSVIMPVYNVEPYLDAAIASVLGQDVSDIELILVDDASTDNGRRIIAKYWRKDPRVRVFGLDHNTLGGAGIPSNVGIRAARGEFIAFADSDDYMTKSGLARMLGLAQDHGAELVIGDFRTFSDKLKEGTRGYDHAVWNDFPLGTSISAFSHPSLFRLSPVPWRKLYRHQFLKDHGILYPEGDYFYEDNPLHWFVLSRAHRVIACDEIISYHRQEREGQTMGAQSYKLGAFVNHANTVLNFISESTDERRNILFEAFFSYLDRSNWAVKAQTQSSSATLIRRGLGDVYERATAAAPDVPVPPLIRSRLATYRSAYPDLDLTVVIPVFNSADLLSQTLDSVLQLSGVTFNVLIVDDGSKDDSLAVMRDYESRHANVHVFAQGNRGAGRARNSIIPLCTGRFTFFLDADDLVDADGLAAAVVRADAESADLMFLKYQIDHVDEGRTQPMFGSDREIWAQLPDADGNEERRRLVAQLINYPWNRIIRTALLHDANIFFGATVVHNDVLFHWHSIVSARNVSYLEVEVCAHRKFATREQVTNIRDARRLAVLEALRSTHERISVLDGYASIQPQWEKFALHLLDWAEDRVPESLRAHYRARSAEIAASFRK